MLDHYQVHKKFKKIKKIAGTGKLDDIKTSINMADKVQNSQNITILMTCVKKDKGKFYP